MPVLSAWHRPFIFTSYSRTEILLRENKSTSLSRNLCVFFKLSKVWYSDSVKVMAKS